MNDKENERWTSNDPGVVGLLLIGLIIVTGFVTSIVLFATVARLNPFAALGIGLVLLLGAFALLATNNKQRPR